MKESLAFIICTFIFMTLITIVYFSKDRLENSETKIYNKILLLGGNSVILEILLCLNILVDVKLYSIYNLFINRTFLISLFMWFTIFTMYIFTISYGYNKEKNKIWKIFSILISLLLILLPIDLINENGVAYSSGPATYVLYLIAVLYTIIWIIVIFKNIKKIGLRKIIPVFSFCFCFTILLILRALLPEILLNSFSVAFATILMYFTIENPDVKMIEELNKNRRLIEKANEEKSNFLFRMAQEVRQPIDNIIEANGVMKKIEHNEEMDKGIKYIEYESKNLKSIVNDVLGISRIDAYNIKLYKTNYRPAKFFEEIFAKYKTVVNEKIEYRTNINKNIPEILYGDAIKLKQVLSTILDNSVKYTKEGFIECNVDAIIKNDICRLVITIEDSGIGMSIDKVNEILSYDQELTEEEIESLDKVNLNLKIASKIIRLLGGNIIVRSEEKQGTEFIIVLEQKIKKTKILKIKEYEQTIRKRVLLVDNNKEFIEEVTKELKKYEIEVLSTMYGNDCVEKIRNNQKYDLILLDDDMEPDSGLATLKELKKISKFKIPVIVTLEKGKEPIKEHYLEEGFKDYLLKEELETEIKRIKENYL